MQSGSPCLGAGQYGYNYGSVYSIDRPGIPEFFEVTDAAIEGQIQVRWVNPSTTVNGNPITSLSSVKIWRNETLVEESNLTSIGDTLIFYDTVERPDYFRYRLCAVDDSDNNGRITFSPFAIRGGEFGGIVIWDLDLSPVSGAEIESALGEIAYSNHIYLTNTPNKYPLNENVDAVFVCLGVYAENHPLSSSEGEILKDYLDNGGNLYMEGADTWNYDTPSPVHSYFNINGTEDGTSDLSYVAGIEGSPFEGLDFSYSGSNSYIDHLLPVNGAELILENKVLHYGIGVGYDGGTYKTIGTSFQLGGLIDGSEPNTKKVLVEIIMNYFGLGALDIDDNDNRLPQEYALNQNYPNPFNPTTTVKYHVKSACEVNLVIYNSLGQKVKTLVKKHQIAGKYEMQWNGSNDSGHLMSSGIYFLRMNADSYVKVRRMVLLK